MGLRSIGIIFSLAFIFLPVRARAELTEGSDKKVEEKLKGFQVTIRMQIQAINGRVREFTYNDAEEYRLSLESAQQRLADSEKAERLYGAAGPIGEARAREYRASAARARADIKDIEKALKTIQKDEAKADADKIKKAQDEKLAEKGKKLSPAERTALKKEIAKWRTEDETEIKKKLETVQRHRTDLVRNVIDKIKSETYGLNPAETVLFLEKVSTTFEPNSQIFGQLDLKQAFGPGYGPNEFQGRLSARLIDVLAEWGTKEAWAAIARIADKGKVGATRLAAVQHLLAGVTAEKAKGIQSVESPGTTLQAVKALQALAPHKFNAETTYVDMRSPESAVVKYDPANKDFRGKEAKERFLPATSPVSSLTGFSTALEVSTPVNRWSWLPGKLKTAIKPPEPVAVAETVQAAAPPEVQPEPVAEISAPVIQSTEPRVSGRAVGEQPPTVATEAEWKKFERTVGSDRASELVTFLLAYLHTRQLASVPPAAEPEVPGRPNQNQFGRPENERYDGKQCDFARLGRYNHRGQR